MILLGMDTSTPATAVALRLADGETLEARDDPPQGARPGHTSQLLPLAAMLLGRAGVDWDALQGIAVGLGPGTFTGLRVGVASARALAQSLGVGLIGVSSLQALALPALGAREDLAGEVDGAAGPPRVLAVLDARRGEAFLAAYESGGSNGEEAGAMRERLSPRALRPEQLGEAVAALGCDAAGEESVGRDGAGDVPERGGARERGGSTQPWLAVGDGAVLFAEQLRSTGVEVAAEDSRLHLLRAAALCELAMSSPAAETVEQVLPSYGRRPDAELALEAATR